MTLREQIAADVSSVHINTDDFAETLTYKPADGAARSISGVVDEEGDFPETQFGRSEREFLDVFVSRDSTAGIDDPQFGDRIHREGESDKWYSFTGHKLDIDEFAWALRFVRDVGSKHGGLPKT